MKNKKCKNCSEVFAPFKSTDKFCSLKCSKVALKADTAKKKEKTSRKPKKIKTLAKLSDDAAVLLQRLVRLKASDDNGYCSCVTCGKTAHFKDMDGGHFIERGVKKTKLMEENIHPQCKGCNGFGMKYKATTVLDYRRYMVDMYGEEFVKELENAKHDSFRFIRFDLLEKIKDFSKQISEQEKRIGV